MGKAAPEEFPEARSGGRNRCASIADPVAPPDDDTLERRAIAMATTSWSDLTRHEPEVRTIAHYKRDYAVHTAGAIIAASAE